MRFFLYGICFFIGLILISASGCDKLHYFSEKQAFDIIKEESKSRGLSFIKLSPENFRQKDYSHEVILIFNSDKRHKTTPSSIYFKDISTLNSYFNISENTVFFSEERGIVIVSNKNVEYKESKTAAFIYDTLSLQSIKEMTLFLKTLPQEEILITFLMGQGYSRDDAVNYVYDAICYNLDMKMPNADILDMDKIVGMASQIESLYDQTQNFLNIFGVIRSFLTKAFPDTNASVMSAALYLYDCMNDPHSYLWSISNDTDFEEIDRIIYHELFMTQRLVNQIDGLTDFIPDLNVEMSSFSKSKPTLLVFFIPEPSPSLTNDSSPQIAEYRKTITYFFDYFDTIAE